MSAYCSGACHTKPVLMLGHLHTALVLLCSCIRRLSAYEKGVVFVCFVGLCFTNSPSLIKVIYDDFWGIKLNFHIVECLVHFARLPVWYSFFLCWLTYFFIYFMSKCFWPFLRSCSQRITYYGTVQFFTCDWQVLLSCNSCNTPPPPRLCLGVSLCV